MVYKPIIFLLFIFFILFINLPSVFSDPVEIVIEYGSTLPIATTASAPTATQMVATTSSGNGGDGGRTTTISITEPVLTYTMPASFEINKNEIKEFTVKVTNPGVITLHNLTINITGIPKNSYSLIPSLVNSLESNKYTYFNVSIDTQNIAPGSYTLNFNISARETYEQTTMNLKVGEKSTITVPTVTTTTVPPEEKEKIKAGMNIVKVLSIAAGIVVITMIVTYYVRSMKKPKEIQQIIEEKDVNSEQGGMN